MNSLFMLTDRTHQNVAQLAQCDQNPPVTGGFPQQRPNNAKSIGHDFAGFPNLHSG